MIFQVSFCLLKVIIREIENQFSWQPRNEKTEFFPTTWKNLVFISLGCQNVTSLKEIEDNTFLTWKAF